jgi:hypothetical protein
MEPFLRNRHRYHYRDWALDSGAFSAHNSGTVIGLRAYTDACKKLLAGDPTLTEVFSLDVIGDWRASLKNTEAMWADGVPAVPTYHVGEPESVLLGMAKDYPKIALGGAVGYRDKDRWAAQCFARVWPKPVHGLGFGSEKSLMALPWHSVDATNWEIGPCKFGRWQSYGQMSVRGSKQNLRAEVEWYLALERRARVRWKREMAKLASLVTAPGPTVRLSAQQSSDAQVIRSGLTEPSRAELNPSLRLAVDAGSGSGHRAGSALRPPGDEGQWP